METEERFHLQLTIQKLEEELTLYRNGTRAQHFMDIIAEKDAEINLLTSAATERNTKLKQLARSSAELVTKYNALVAEKEGSVADNNTLSTKIVEKEEQLKETHDTLVERDYVIRTLDESNKELLQQIESLEGNIKSLNEDVQKLQDRCAQLVSEKAEKSRLLEKEKSEKSRQISEYREELEKAMKFNMDIKTKLGSEHKNALEIASRLREMQQLASDNNKKALVLEAEKEKYKSRASAMHSKYLLDRQQLEIEVEQLRASLSVTTQSKLDMQDAYKRELNSKSNRITELEAHIKTLQLQSWIPPKSSAYHVSNDKENTGNRAASIPTETSKSIPVVSAISTDNAGRSKVNKANKGTNGLKTQSGNTNHSNQPGSSSTHYPPVPANIWVKGNDLPV